MPRRSDRWTNLHDARAAARAALPRMVFDFVDGGAGDEVSARANLSAYADVRFAPRVLVDVSELRLGHPVRRPGADAHDVLREIGLSDSADTLERAWVLQTTALPAGWDHFCPPGTDMED